MKKVNMHYNEEGDVLEVCIGKPTESYFEEIDNGFFERIDRKTGEQRGFIILSFKKKIMKSKTQQNIFLEQPQ